MTTIANATDRRVSPRLPLAARAHLSVEGRYLRGEVLDASSTGLKVSAEEPVEAGEQVRLSFALPYADGNRYCTLVGTVVRMCVDPSGKPAAFGVELDGLRKGSLDQLLLDGYLTAGRA